MLNNVMESSVNNSGGSSNSDGGGGGGKTGAKHDIVINMMVSLKKMSIGTLLLPLCSMAICFVTAYIFQTDQIHETHCRVYNIIPSISAITGISPQRYLWRISIAVHIGPRVLITFVYLNYYRQRLQSMVDTLDVGRIRTAKRLITTCHLLSLTECSALLGVTYISNRENYPMHEKIFIVFMTSSLVYMLLTIRLLHVMWPQGPQNPQDEASLKWKKIFFGLSIASAIGLLIFFAKHRFLCHDMAFSWFAFCEYCFALSNMAFHITTMIDFPTEHLMVVRNAELLKENLAISHSPDGTNNTQKKKLK